MRFDGFARLAFAGSSLLLGTTAAHSQETTAPEAEQVGIAEVVVTARNRSERAQDVPIPISVLSGDKLDRDRVFTVADLTNARPDSPRPPPMPGAAAYRFAVSARPAATTTWSRRSA